MCVRHMTYIVEDTATVAAVTVEAATAADSVTVIVLECYPLAIIACGKAVRELT